MFRPHWPAQKIALRDVASLDTKEVQLQLLLDSFSHDLQTKPSTEGDDGVHDFFCSCIPSQSGNEGAVDLDLVYGELSQACQVRMTGAEVIDGNGHALLTKPPKALEETLVVGERECPFRDLELEVPRVEWTRAQDALDDFGGGHSPPLSQRDVDGNGDFGQAGREPCLRLAAGVTHRPVTERYHEAAGLGHRNEDIGTDHA